MKKVLVVIPTYNEALNIARVVRAVQAVARQAKGYSFRLLIADDMSPDGTAENIRDLQATHSNIHLLSGKKTGLGRAYIRSFRYALQHEAFDVLIMMDADLSHDPKDIPALLKQIEAGNDYVIGSRYVSGGSVSADLPLIRKINSRVANFVARRLVGITQPVYDLTGGFKAIRREPLEQIALDGLKAKGYFFQVSLLHAFLLQGFKVSEVPITFVNRSLGSSKLKMRDIIEFVYSAYKLNPDAPLQKFVRFTLVGACGAVVNLAVLSFLVKIAGVEVLLSVAVAIELSILFNFTLNHRYTFKGYGSYPLRTHRESLRALALKMGTYNLGALGGAIISFTTFSLLFKLGGTPYLAADIIAIGTATSWNYWVSTRYVWRAIDKN